MTDSSSFISLRLSSSIGLLAVICTQLTPSAVAQCVLDPGTELQPFNQPWPTTIGFGRSVAIDDGLIAVGQPCTNSVYLYRHDGTNWIQEESLSRSGGGLPTFGHSLSVSGDLLLVGTPEESHNRAGAAYIFRYNGANWIQEAELIPSDPGSNDKFGFSVSIRGTVALVSALFGDGAAEDSGAVYVFRYDGTNWTETQKLTVTNSGFQVVFGYHIYSDGDTMIVGSHNATNGGLVDAGLAYVFRDDGSNWVLEQEIGPSDPGLRARFGNAVSIKGDLAIVGASQDAEGGLGAGAAYVFRHDGTDWIQELKLVGVTQGESLGKSVAISEEIAWAGGNTFWSAGNPIGICRVYHFDGVSWRHQAQILDPNWTHLGGAMDLDGKVGVLAATNLFYACDGASPYGRVYAFDGDSDGDGLFNWWETCGIDVNEDGVIDLFLPGSDPNHKNLYVEIDAMVGRAPGAAAIQDVIDAFDAVPNALLNNPDGVDGITLHVETDEMNIPVAAWAYPPWSDFDSLKMNYFGTAAQRADPAMWLILRAKKQAYRYCVFADQFGGSSSSGFSELPGNDFMVTLGLWTPPGGTRDQQAGTFMHELGHTLGLYHGGDQVDLANDRRYNYKPNYHSVLNYSWQVPQLAYGGSWLLDYSREDLPDLDETSLSEASGIGATVVPHPSHVVPVGPLPVGLAPESGGVDWNRDGDIIDNGLAIDINWAVAGDTLEGHTDWDNLKYNFRLLPAFGDGSHGTEEPVELSFENWQQMNGWGDCNSNGVVDYEDIKNGTSADHNSNGYPDECECEACDTNCDGNVDSLDIDPFLDLLFEGGVPCSFCAGDANRDGVVDSLDIDPFLECLFP